VRLPSERLAELGITLPPVAAPLAAYVPAVRYGDLVYTSGQLPTVGGELVLAGLVGGEVTADQGAECARTAVLNALAAAAGQAGDIDAVVRIVRVMVYVAAVPGFAGHAQVANGASELLQDVFGPAGRHARSAVGVAGLPLNAPVEVELVVAVGSSPTIHPA
jgi:enamine deaminase RidA (YjgF/YER057c/UK114 family)